MREEQTLDEAFFFFKAAKASFEAIQKGKPHLEFTEVFFGQLVLHTE